MARYIDDTEFYYEVVLSKGCGKLTKKAENMIIRIGEEMIKKFERKYKTTDDKFDCMQQGILMMFQNWQGFKEMQNYTFFH